MKCSIKFFVISCSLFVIRFPAWACPNCKDAIGEATARSFNASILWMIGAVFLVVGVISVVLWRAVRKGRVLPHAPHERSS